MPLAQLIERLKQTSTTPVSTEEYFKQLRRLAGAVPEWCKIVSTSQGLTANTTTETHDTHA